MPNSNRSIIYDTVGIVYHSCVLSDYERRVGGEAERGLDEGSSVTTAF